MTGEPWITHLDSSEEYRDRWNHDTGMPGVALFANAVQVWVGAQNRTVTVNDAALAFNVAPHLIRQAVEWHYWLYLGPGDTIEQEGE